MIPTRSETQRLEALELANEERSHKAKVKKQLKAGSIDPMDVLCDPPTSMTVREFLMSMRRFGELKTTKVCQQTGLRPHKRLSALTERQCQELVATLDRGHWKAGKFCDCGKKLSHYNQSGVCKTCITEQSAERRATVIDLHKRGFTPWDIGEEVGLEPKSVSEILRVAA